MSRKAAFVGVEKGVSGAILDGGAGAKAVVDSVADLLAGVLRRSALAEAALFDEAPSLADSAVRGAVKAGGDLGSVARGFLLGALRGSGLMGEAALQAAEEASGAFVKCVLEAGGDAPAAARGLVEGVLVWADEVGQDAARAASAVAQADVDAAYCFGAKSGARVRDAVREGIGGVSIVVKKR
jgi:hypothetical protein